MLNRERRMTGPGPDLDPYQPAPPGRPTWLEIDLDALAHNVGRLRRTIGSDCRLMAVVKANAYGHGAVPIVRTALQAGATYLGVATLGEALELRQAGMDAPILILGYTPPWQAPDLVRHQLTATIFDLETARALAEASSAAHYPATVHVKVDTGMHRLGLYPQGVPDFLAALAQLPGLQVEGIYTHFSTADEGEKDFTRRQFGHFTRLLQDLAATHLRPPIAHAANSAATLSLPETHLQMVRCGIALYGLHPSPDTPLPPNFRPVLGWKAQIAQVKRLRPGDFVSYGNTYQAPDFRTVAILPVGYADGFPRTPCHWGDVLIHGQPAPILGRVCMDQTVVDVTDIRARTGKLVHAGDEAVLLGTQDHAILSAEDVARRLGTINYEVVSALLARLPRITTGGHAGC